ncbi:hypothetical protein ACHAXR_007530 [Thalassiosira sp. AJA248-18]
MAAAKMDPPPAEYRILALYRFVPLVSPNDDNEDDEALYKAYPERHPSLCKLQSELRTTLRRYDAKGTLLIAPEGINGTICYPFPPPTTANDGVGKDGDDEDPVAMYLKTHPLFGGPALRTRLSIWKEEEGSEIAAATGEEGVRRLHKQPQQAFHRLKIKIKAEIVTLGLGRPLIDRKPIVKLDEEVQGKISNMEQIIADGGISAGQSNVTTSTSSSIKTNITSSHHRHESNQLANPLATKGQYLTPTQWDEACHNPNILVIDTRNTYEIEIGTFESAIDPKTQNFSDFPEFMERLAEEYDWSSGCDEVGQNDIGGGNIVENDSRVYDSQSSKSSATDANNTSKQSADINTKKKKPPPEGIAMFCTGGIRCEKATSYALQSKLFPKVPIYHLEGGILAYLDERDKGKKVASTSEMNDSGNQSSSLSKSTFHGECFVFDKRVAVGEGLKPSTTYISCHGCRGPMDHRLMMPNVNLTKDNEADQKYQKLMQISNLKRLPPLRYDPITQQHYLPGLTCPRCHTSTTRESLERFSQRERQIDICSKDGKAHFEDKPEKDD